MLQQAYHAANHEHSCYNMFHNLVQTVKEMSNTSWAQRKPLATGPHTIIAVHARELSPPNDSCAVIVLVKTNSQIPVLA